METKNINGCFDDSTLPVARKIQFEECFIKSPIIEYKTSEIPLIT